MKIFKFIPLFSYLLIAYVLIFVIQKEASIEVLQSTILQVKLFSGAQFSLSWSGVFLILSSLFLFFEILKSTNTSNASIIDHMLSALVFIIFLIVFIVMPEAATEAYFVVMLMSLIDVIAGFTITITSARKDFSMDHSL